MAQSKKSIVIIILIVIVLVAAMVWAGKLITPKLSDLIGRREQFKNFVLKAKLWAPISMIALQIVQVIVAPVPGHPVAFLSGYFFGIFKGTLLCMAGLIIGSIVAFLISRVFGRRLLRYLISEAKLRKFDSYALKQGPFLLFLFLLIPNPIGDVMYYLAGLTNIPLEFYVVLVIVSKLPSNILNNILGAKASTFSVQGWIIFGTLITIIALLYYLNKNRIEGLFLKMTRIPGSNEY
ncbi:MAG: VTT domain-containing protein [candidate division WOR-3 bacterium]|nr:VTT domain-containing protein [candidate division WOR-3 bacterium]MDH5684695.1 VTT domain-containing protein [candidate division WOR-3 bacterium]